MSLLGDAANSACGAQRTEKFGRIFEYTAFVSVVETLGEPPGTGSYGPRELSEGHGVTLSYLALRPVSSYDASLGQPCMQPDMLGRLSV